MQLGIVLLVLSVVSAVLFQTSYDGSGMKVLIFVLALVNLVLNAVIGKLGGKLMESKMPG
jgi:uncharacterized membrane protein